MTDDEPRLRAIVGDVLLAAFRAEKNSVYVVSSAFEMLFFNDAYRRFSADNGGEPRVTTKFGVGASVLDAISTDVRPHFEQRCREAMSTGTPWIHEFLCHGPGVYRECHQIAYPLQDGRGLAFVNSTRVERPTIDPVRPPIDDAPYRRGDGLILQCSNCRRTERSDTRGVWDWVPDLVERMRENTSHGICAMCFEHYWR